MNFTDNGYFGYDVSFYQDIDTTPQKIDFMKMRNYGASFVIVRTGQYTYQDEDFKDNWANAKAAGIPRGSYWFCDADSTGVSQARLYANLLGNDRGEGIHFADFEGGSWTNWKELYNFISEFQYKTGLPNDRVGIYTGYYYWKKYGPQTAAERKWFGKYPLWLAWYSSNPLSVLVPEPWTEVVLWQDAIHTNGLEVGVESREIDHDKFNGNSDTFIRFFGQEPVTPPPTGGEVILYYADLKSGYTSNVRSGPGLASPIIDSLLGPVTISIVSEAVPQDNYVWYQISAPKSGWIALTSSYTNIRKADSTTVPAIMEVTLKLPTVLFTRER